MAIGETIIFTNDLDGVHFKAPLPAKTAWQLLRRKEFTSRELHDREARRGLKAKASVFLASLRPFTPDSLRLLGMIDDARQTYERNIQIAVLSGRDREFHEMTMKRLSKKHASYIDHYFLNESTSSVGWKEHIAKKILESGGSIAHIDDDLRPALRIASLNQKAEDGTDRVIVYLVKNWSNSDILLKRANIVLPDNLVRVGDAIDVAHDFHMRLRKGRF